MNDPDELVKIMAHEGESQKLVEDHRREDVETAKNRKSKAPAEEDSPAVHKGRKESAVVAPDDAKFSGT